MIENYFLKEEKEMSLNLQLGTKDTWEGVVQNIIFMNDKNFGIFDFLIKGEKQPIKALGTVSNLQKSAYAKITGEVVWNDKYNENQIKISSAIVNSDKDAIAATLFISSNAIPGFTTNKSAADFINHFGSDLYSYMEDVKKLCTYKRMTEKRAKNIAKAFKENKHLYPLFKLVGSEMTYNKAIKIHQKYGSQSFDVISSNPYALAYSIDGFGFHTVDKIAMSLGIKYDSNERILAALNFSLQEAQTGGGHMYLPLEDAIKNTAEIIFSIKELKAVFYIDVLGMKQIPDDLSDWNALTLAKLVSEATTKRANIYKILEFWSREETRDAYCKKYKFTSEEIDTIDAFYDKKLNFELKIENLIADYSINSVGISPKQVIENINDIHNAGKLFITGKGAKGEDSISLIRAFRLEWQLASMIIDLIESDPLRTIDPVSLEELIEADNEFELEPEQKQAVRLAVTNRLSIISGGPGRGKTTVIKKAISGWLATTGERASVPQIILLAPTGKAAKRMSEATGFPAMTIHRFLIKNGSKTERMECDCIKDNDTLVFIDESSMLDIPLAKRLLACIKRAQICFVGDADQLPSVGPGAFLEDLIKSDKVPYVLLNACHRNAGSILDNAEAINNGAHIGMLKNDIHFRTFWTDDNNQIINAVLFAYKNMCAKYGTNEVIVLSPMRERPTGVNQLNRLLRDCVNPQENTKPEIPIGKTGVYYRLGDRIIQNKNNYEHIVVKDGESTTGIFNGETGTITDIGTNELDEPYAIVRFDDGKIAEYTISDFTETSLAYALTYHKSQGSEYKAVICILTTGDYMLLQRKILYTGETRAKDACLFVGNSKAFAMAISNINGAAKRCTLLAKMLIA